MSKPAANTVAEAPTVEPAIARFPAVFDASSPNLVDSEATTAAAIPSAAPVSAVSTCALLKALLMVFDLFEAGLAVAAEVPTVGVVAGGPLAATKDAFGFAAATDEVAAAGLGGSGGGRLGGFAGFAGPL